MKKLLLTLFLAGIAVCGVQAQRVTDKLTRGLVAIPQGDKTGQDSRYGTSGPGIFVSWRILPSEYYDTQYNLYRDGTKVNETPLTVSNFQDNGGSKTSLYKVVPVVKGRERSDLASETVTPWEHQYWEIPVQPVVGRDGKEITGYSLNDCSVADVDGDGQMEFVVKRRNDSGNLRQSGNQNNFNLHECYKMDGTRLWWIDMGPNMMAGPDEQFDLILYDWDQDGRAEALMRGADNMIIHTATGKTIKVGDMNYYAPRDEYTKQGREYLIYLNGATGEPYLGWDGGETWTPMDYPLPRYEVGEARDLYNATEDEYKAVWGDNDTGHRSMKHYLGAPYLDGRNASIFLGRGCYTRHKFCALDVNPETHELTQRWRWNCYDGKSPWFGNGFHNFAIADVDMDGRDEIVFGSMIIDDTGYGLSTTGFGHGDAQHCGDLDPYRWGLEQFACLESSYVPGIAYTDATASALRYSTGAGADNGRCMAGNFQGTYPGAIGVTYGYDAMSLVADRVITGMNLSNDDFMNMRIYWDGDLLDEFMDSPGVERDACVYKAPGQKEVHTGRSYPNNRCFLGNGQLNNSSKNNPGFLGDILGDWREEIVVRYGADALRIFTTSYESPWGITSLWYDHEYRNAMTWQSVGYNQPPHPSFFLGELEGITKEPPAVTLEGRTEVTGTIGTTDDHLIVSGYEDKTIAVEEGASPYILTVNAPAWIQGSGAQQAVASTPKDPARTLINYTTTLTGGAFTGATRLVKQGEGTLVLPNVTEQHTGATDVWNGTLVFDGTMASSPVWLNRHTALVSDGGQFKAGVKADYNAAIYPGGKQKVGSISISELTLGFGARVVLDWADGFDQLNADKLVVETKEWMYGPKYKAPVLEFVVAGEVVEGVYDLGTIGSVEGDLSAIIIEGLGNNVLSSLNIEDGKLKLSVQVMRESDTVTWNGTASNSTWEQAVSENFVRENETAYQANGDDVIFDDNAASTDITIKGVVSPRSVTFNNDTKAYTINGDSIVGGATITKNGKGKVTFNNWNNTGTTTINGGTVVVTMLANKAGQTFGSLGNVKSVINLNDGATLQTNGVIITDQKLNVNGDVKIDVPAQKSVIFNAGIKGGGSTVTKTGTGSMELGQDNTFSKLIVKAGTVYSNHNDKVVEQLPQTVEFQGGTLWGANRESNPYLTNNTDFIVPKGKTGTFYGAFGGNYRGTLTGEGTFNVYTGGVRCYFDGDWSAFEGTVVAKKNNRQNKKSYDPVWMFRNTNGMPLATLSIDENVRVSNEGNDVPLGKVEGKGTLVGSGNWILGSNDQDFVLSTEVGITSSRKDDYGNTIDVAPTKIVKVGAGKMSILSLGKINAQLTVKGGTVSFSDMKMDNSLCGSNSTVVSDSGRIVGQGLINALTVDAGGEVIPCGSVYNETTPGTLSTSALCRVNEGGTLNFLLSASKQSTLTPFSLIMNGTVKVTLLSGYAPKNGDEFTLWTVNRSFSGTPKFDLPELPEGLYWDIDGVANKTGVLRVTDDASVGVSRIGAGETVSCEVYTAGGARVGQFQARRSELRSRVRQLGVQAGVYIVKMQGSHGQDAETVVVK